MLKRILLLIAIVARADDVKFDRIASIPAPGSRIEIVKYDERGKLLVGTDSSDHSVDFQRVASWEPPVFELVRRVPMPGEPTSVAIAPDGAAAWVTVCAAPATRKGWVECINPGTFKVEPVSVGYHPDSLAISPDGKWVVIANEAEGDDTTPGSIGLIDIQTGSYTDLPGLEIVGQPTGVVEPEFVAIDPESRYAAVSCQENDTVVLADLRAEQKRVVSKVALPPGSEPDGVDLLDDVLAVAEEKGQCVSFHRIDSESLSCSELARVDVRPLVDPAKPEKSRQPESVKLVHWNGRLLALVGIERGDRVLCLDLANPAAPRLLAHAATGDRPEGLTVARDGDDLIVITGDEGKDGERGTITFSRLTNPQRR